MTWEAATFGLTLIVLVMQAVSIYTVAKIKVWALERFVTKGDFLETLNMWSRTDAAQKAKH